MKRAFAMLVTFVVTLATIKADVLSPNAAKIELVGIHSSKGSSPLYRFRIQNTSKRNVYYFGNYHLERLTWFGSRAVDTGFCGYGARLSPLAPGRSTEFLTYRASWFWPWRAGVNLSATGKGDPHEIPYVFFWSPHVR